MKVHGNLDITPLVSFVTPTLRRKSLANTIESVMRQTDDDWEHVVQEDEAGSAGITRNEAIRRASGDWLAFVDDDDTVDPEYVQSLRWWAEVTGADVIVFRMQYPNGMILPHPERPKLEWGLVGISFAMKSHWHDDFPSRDIVMPGSPRVRFIAEDLANQGPKGNEDICMLNDLREAGAKVVVPDERPLYYVNHTPPYGE